MGFVLSLTMKLNLLLFVVLVLFLQFISFPPEFLRNDSQTGHDQQNYGVLYLAHFGFQLNHLHDGKSTEHGHRYFRRGGSPSRTAWNFDLYNLYIHTRKNKKTAAFTCQDKPLSYDLASSIKVHVNQK